MTAQRELIINGPIACGKSMVAQALAAQRRGSGSSAAVLDLDLMYAMLHDGPLMSDPHIARLAQRAPAALVDHCILDGIQLLIVEGDF